MKHKKAKLKKRKCLQLLTMRDYKNQTTFTHLLLQPLMTYDHFLRLGNTKEKREFY